MLHSSASRCLSLLTLLASAVLIAAAVPVNAAAADWMRGYTPARSRALEAAGEPIDPADFREPLLVAAIFQETNQRRADLKLPAFLPDEKASVAARLHARWMASTHALSHDEPSGQGTPITSFDRLVQQGLRPHLSAENIAYNLLPEITPGRLFYTRLVDGRQVYSYQSDGPALRVHTYEDFARAILAQWMHSPLHRAHIVDPELRCLGVGVALAHRRGHPDTIYGVQDFFTPHVFSSASVTNSTEATLIPPRP